MSSDLSIRPASQADLDYIEGLLAANELPTADIHDQLESLYVFEIDGDSVGVGGLEVYDDVGLLRSIAVEDAKRGNGYGTAVCQTLLVRASEGAVSTVYLLTTTAADFFERLGFESVERTAVPEAIQQSREFSELCPSTAVCMSCDIEPRQFEAVPIE